MDLAGRGVGSLESRSLTVCSGLDLVNITYNNFVAADEKTAKVGHAWMLLSQSCYVFAEPARGLL